MHIYRASFIPLLHYTLLYTCTWFLQLHNHTFLESWSDYGIPSCECTISELKTEEEPELSDPDLTDLPMNVDVSFKQFDREGNFSSYWWARVYNLNKNTINLATRLFSELNNDELYGHDVAYNSSKVVFPQKAKTKSLTMKPHTEVKEDGSKHNANINCCPYACHTNFQFLKWLYASENPIL